MSIKDDPKLINRITNGSDDIRCIQWECRVLWYKMSHNGKLTILWKYANATKMHRADHLFFELMRKKNYLNDVDIFDNVNFYLHKSISIQKWINACRWHNENATKSSRTFISMAFSVFLLSIEKWIQQIFRSKRNHFKLLSFECVSVIGILNEEKWKAYCCVKDLRVTSTNWQTSTLRNQTNWKWPIKSIPMKCNG